MSVTQKETPIFIRGVIFVALIVCIYIGVLSALRSKVKVENLQTSYTNQTVFTKEKPTVPGLYLYRQDGRFTHPRSWGIAEIYEKRGVLWIDDFTGYPWKLSNWKGEFSVQPFADPHR